MKNQARMNCEYPGIRIDGYYDSESSKNELRVKVVEFSKASQYATNQARMNCEAEPYFMRLI